MTYTVKEIFLTLQGEGAQTGRSAVFCRFAGCNLWSGLERDRDKARCNFCDTDFVGTDGPGGGRFSDATALARAILDLWPSGGGAPYVVFTGGEPLLQLDDVLIRVLKESGAAIAIETNGTIAAPASVDWICVSPKGHEVLAQNWGDELKLVFPQDGVDPAKFEGLAFDHFYLQPKDGPAALENGKAAIDYCLHHPRWKLSVQTHKFLGLP